MTYMKASVFSVAFSILALGAGEAGAQYVYTPPSSGTLLVPLAPTYQPPPVTYIAPAPPAPRVDIPFYTPPPRTVVCTMIGTINYCN